LGRSDSQYTPSAEGRVLRSHLGGTDRGRRETDFLGGPGHALCGQGRGRGGSAMISKRGGDSKPGRVSSETGAVPTWSGLGKEGRGNNKLRG